MNSKRFALAQWVIALTIASVAQAQPTLNRVEQQMRDQVEGRNSATKAPPREPGFLGIIADDRQEAGRGVRIVDVTPQGPAALGGLQDNDLITAINGQAVHAMDDMARSLLDKTAGAKVTFTVDRKGQTLEQMVTLGTRPTEGQPPPRREEMPLPGQSPAQPGGIPPAQPTEAPQGPRLGVRTIPLTPEVQRQNDLRTTDGALVVAVKVGSPADRAQIPVGAIITAVDGVGIAAPQDLTNAVRGVVSPDITVTYVFRGQEMQKPISLTAGKESPKLELGSRPLQGEPRPPLPDSEMPTPFSAEARIAELEAHVRQLEQRIEQLEAALPKPKE